MTHIMTALRLACVVFVHPALRTLAENTAVVTVIELTVGAR